MFGPDWLANLFLSIFLFGLLFTVASLLLGFGHTGGVGHAHSGGGHAHAGGHHAHLHTDQRMHTHLDVAGQHDGPGLLNTPTLMCFLTWLGGTGYLFRHSLNLGGYVSTALALIFGIAGASIMFTLLARWLWPMMSKPLNSADYSLPGTAARVVSSIREDGVGEIVYTKGGTRFTAGARSTDRQAILRGTEVVILKYERGMAYVQDVHAALNGAYTKEESA